jgi:hypothetical protein
MTNGLSLKLLAGIAMVLTATPISRAVAVEQPRTPFLIPNIQEPEEMRVAPFPVRNTVPTAADRALEEKIRAGQAKMRALSLSIKRPQILLTQSKWKDRSRLNPKPTKGAPMPYANLRMGPRNKGFNRCYFT